jgi:hypothetical protein
VNLQRRQVANDRSSGPKVPFMPSRQQPFRNDRFGAIPIGTIDPLRPVKPARGAKSTAAFKVQRPFVDSHRETGVRPLPTLGIGVGEATKRPFPDIRASADANVRLHCKRMGTFDPQ